jgi:hypothetical protein
LKSSKNLDAVKGGYFVDQYFAVDNYASTTPTLYIESQKQFDIFINYFLGELEIQYYRNDRELKDEEIDLLSKIKNNSQYSYTNATYKLYKSALNDLNASMVYKDTQTFGDWVALPSITNRSIDFSNITIEINNLTNRYYEISKSWNTSAFISSLGNEENEYSISNLNLQFNIKTTEDSNYATGGCIFGGIVGVLNRNATISNCKVKYTGSKEIKCYDNQDETYAGPIAGKNNGTITNCESDGFGNGSIFVDYEYTTNDKGTTSESTNKSSSESNVE